MDGTCIIGIMREYLEVDVKATLKIFHSEMDTSKKEHGGGVTRMHNP